MGGLACCGGNVDEEVKGAKTVEELSQVMDKKSADMVNEMKDINGYLKSKNKEEYKPKYNIKGFDDKTLQDRNQFLGDLNKVTKAAAYNLKNNRNLKNVDVEKIKPYLNQLCSLRSLNKDTEGELNNLSQNFQKFLNNPNEETPKK